MACLADGDTSLLGDLTEAPLVQEPTVFCHQRLEFSPGFV
jgi:hypothetical protein